MGTERPDGETLIVRPVEIDDLEVVRALEAAYTARTGTEARIDQGGLHHVARSGHAFVAVRAAAVRGMVLAHTVWDGSRPLVWVVRLVAADDDAGVLARLLEALVKSAYDAAVYDLALDLPATDAAGHAAVEAARFTPQPVRRFARVLGSRSAATT